MQGRGGKGRTPKLLLNQSPLEPTTLLVDVVVNVDMIILMLLLMMIAAVCDVTVAGIDTAVLKYLTVEYHQSDIEDEVIHSTVT